MANVSLHSLKARGGGQSDLFKKEDWWAVWLGLGLTLAAIVVWYLGGSA